MKFPLAKLIMAAGMVALSGACMPTGNTPPPTGTPVADFAVVPTSRAADEPFTAPDFSMVGLDGQTYTLADFRGKLVVVNFWATWCGPCRAEMPDLQRVADEYPNKLVVLGVNQRETAEAVQAFADEVGVRFPLLLNPSDATIIDYNVMGLPQTILINREGNIIYRAFGVIDFETFAPLIEEYLG